MQTQNSLPVQAERQECPRSKRFSFVRLVGDTKRSRLINLRVIASAVLIPAVLLWTQTTPVHAEAHYDWDALLNTRRIAIVTPFFCTVPPPVSPPSAKSAVRPKARVIWPQPMADHIATERKSAPQTGRKSAHGKPQSSAKRTLQPAPIHLDPAPIAPKPKSVGVVTEADKSFHTQTLHTLTATLQATLPESIGEGNAYQIAPETEVQEALGRLHWGSRDLFQQRGQLARGKFPTPDVKRIQKLAHTLHVDGVVVTTMREPASIGDGIRLPYELWMVNPFNLGARRLRAHVLSPRVQALLITAEGKTAWQDEQVADHPRTTPRTLKTLLIDWQEATEQVAQQLADSLRRQPPG